MRLTPALAAVLLIAAAAACTESTTACPAPPSMPAVASVETGYAPQTNVHLELSAAYLRQQLREKLAQPDGGNQGARIDGIMTADGTISIGLVPWARADPTAAPVELPRRFRLTLRPQAHLVTARTTPDPGVRRAWLAGADEAVALTFALGGLRDVGAGADLTCPVNDPIGTQVLRGVYDGLGAQQPVIVPLSLVTGIATQLTGGTTAVTGVNVAVDNGLKLGFLLGAGAPKPFFPEALLSRHPDDDWGFEVDTSLVSGLVAERASAVLREADPLAVTNSVGVDFEPTGLFVTVRATHALSWPCPDAQITAKTLTAVEVRRDPARNSVLVATPGEPALDITSGVCLAIATALFGRATAVVGPPGTGAPPPPCPGAIGGPLTFDVPPDRFYATSADTDGTFYVSGRSVHLDGVLGRPSPPLPDC